MKSCLIIALALALCFSFGEAVKCYQCTGSNQNCKEGECQGNYCYKTMGDVAGRSVVNKGCQSTGSNSCSTGTLSGAASGSSCTCNSDWCNASTPTAKVTLGVLFLATFAAFGMRKVFE